MAEGDIRVMLALILDGQRAVLPAAERLFSSAASREQALGSMFQALASLATALATSYWSAPSLLLLVLGTVLGGLHVAGVSAGDLVGLADVAAHAWTQQPHQRCESPSPGIQREQ